MEDSGESPDGEKSGGGNLFETLCMYALMAGFAVFTTIVGAVLLMLIEEFGLPLNRGGDFIASQNIGCFVGILLSGFVIDRFRKRSLIFLFYIAFSACLIAVHFSTTLAAYLTLLVLAGLSSKIIDALLNARISELHRVNKGFFMNLLHCCYGIGSFLGPLYAGTMAERTGVWRPAYLLIGCLCLALALVYGFLFVLRGRQPVAERSAAIGPAASFASIVSRPMGICWLILFCYCGHQIGMNNWFPPYMSENAGVDTITAGFGLSLFWLGLIAGRLACSLLTRRIHEKNLLALGNALGGIGLLAGIAAGGEMPAFAGAVAAGFFAGATIPMVLTLAYTWHPDAQGKVSMAMFIAITVGGTIGPWVMGKLIDANNIGRAMYLNAALLLVVAVLCLVLPGRSPSERSDQGSL